MTRINRESITFFLFGRAEEMLLYAAAAGGAVRFLVLSTVFPC